MFCNNTVLNKQICNECLDKIFFVYSPFCLYCQQESIEGQTHYKCQKRYGADKLITFFEYKGIARDCILQSKFGPKAFSLIYNLIDYALIYKEQFNLNDITKDFLVTSIPGDPQRMNERGFNLAELIAKKISKKLNLKYKELLIKNKRVAPFEKMNKKQRLSAIRNSFKIKSKIAEKIILIDDVLTTGSTLQEAAKVLKKAGAKHVFCLTVCHKPLHSIV